MVKLSAKTDYALRAMIDLAQHPGERTTLPAIAERQGIPRKFLPTVLQSLIQAGFVRTIRGYGGGVELSCDPGTLSLRHLIESMEGLQHLHGCENRADECVYHHACRLRDVLEEAGVAMLAVLERTTLADLLPEVKTPAGMV